MKAEARAILLAAFADPGKSSFAELLASMPNGGEDDDFSRALAIGKIDR